MSKNRRFYLLLLLIFSMQITVFDRRKDFVKDYIFTRQRPNTPSSSPRAFFFVRASPKRNTEPMQTEMIPTPLKSGNKITEGTRPARLVITKLMMQRESALPRAGSHRAFTSPFFSPPSVCLGSKHKEIKRNATRKE